MSDFGMAIGGRASSLAVGLLLQSAAIVLIGLIAGRLARWSGPVWQSLLYRAALSAAALTFLVTLIAAGRVPRRISLATRISPMAVVQPDGPAQGPVSEPSPASSAASAPVVPAAPDPIVFTPRPSAARLRPVGGWLALWPVALWLGVALAGLARNALCRRSLARLTRESSPIQDGVTLSILDDLAARLKVPAPELRSHGAVHTPFLAGIFAPAIYLPEDYESQYDAETLRAILAHEMAHIARRDCAWFLFARLTAVVFWFQPLILLLERRMIQASEEACDAAVVALGCPAQHYADSLLVLVERGAARKGQVYGIGIAPIRSSLGRRIQRILDRSRRYALRVSLRARATVIAVASAAVVLAVLAFCPPALNPLQSAVAGSLDSLPKPPPIPTLLPAWTPPDDYVDHFTFARQQGWTAVPVRTVISRMMPKAKLDKLVPGISTQDRELMRASAQGSVEYGRPALTSAMPPVSLRRKAEQVLAAHPHFAYAEYQVAVWYADHGQMDMYRTWRDRALADAPVILAGRVEHEDGSPVANIAFPVCIAYEQFQQGPVSGGDEVTYDQALTDENGCYYVPALKGIYGFLGFGSTPLDSSGNQQQIPNIGNFVSDARVGLLPPVVYHSYVELTGDLAGKTGTLENPLRLSGASLRVSWKPYPQATEYAAGITEFAPVPTRNKKRKDFDNLGDFSARTLHPGHFPETSFLLKLDGEAPMFGSKHVYDLKVYAFRGNGNEAYSQSRDIYFVAEKGVGSLPD